ncbi:MAG: ADP-ribosylglycohydrolase family protein [Chitinophagaceae bacterium]
MEQKIKAVLLGLAVGDALGVPVEFSSRGKLKQNPVTTMQGFGTWNQQQGTWSDDSSLAFCLAQSLTKGYDLNDIANTFVLWFQEGFWGAHYEVFDVGGATRFAIGRLLKGESPLLSGGMLENDNGNGSLMRILPLLFYLKDFDIEKRYKIIKEVSSITHAHFRSVFACFIYLEYALQILNGASKTDAYITMQHLVKEYNINNQFSQEELNLFNRILKNNIQLLSEERISSGGYVLDTLEASIWCLLNTNNYVDAVLKAVNLGGDTDTTACVTGGLAGLLYGIKSIPNIWINQLARKQDIANLSLQLYKNLIK